MGYAKHVGRVGALAIALGVGIGIGGSPGIAWADETANTTNSPTDNPSPTSTDSDVADSSPVPSPDDNGDNGDNGDADEEEDEDTPPVDEELDPQDPEPEPVEDLDDDHDDGLDGDAPPTRRRDTSPDEPTYQADAVETATAPADPDTLAPDDEPADTTAAPTPPAAPEAAPLAHTVAVLEDPTPPATPVQPGTESTAISLATVLAPLVGGTGVPGAPVESPALLVLLAAARRLNDRTDQSSSALGLAAAALPNTNPAAGTPIINAPNATGVVTGSVIVTDADGNPLTHTVTKPAKGAVTITKTGSTYAFTYTPTAAARHNASAVNAPTTAKQDTFTLTVSDGQGGSVAVAFTVDIKPANTVPTATASSSSGLFSANVYGSIKAKDADKDTLTYTASATAKGGVVQMQSDGDFTYKPSAAARHAAAASTDKTDTFNVTITDGHGGTVTIPVTVKIKPANTTPTKLKAGDLWTNLNSGKVTGKITATDADGDTFTYTVPATTNEGAVTISSDGTFTYTPDADSRAAASKRYAPFWDKSDSFKVTVNDGHGGTKTLTVTVDIAPTGHTNVAPGGGNFTASQPDSITGKVTGTVAATDPERDILTYSGPTTTAKGTLVVNANGAFTYTPTATARHQASATNATADDKKDTFTVTVNDGYGGTTTVAVTVTIGPSVNTAPTNGTYTSATDANGKVTGQATATDANNDTLTYTGSLTTTKGSVVVNPNGGFTYTPTDTARHNAAAVNAPAADKADSFIITVTDGHGGTTTIPITVTILGANTAPTNGSYTSTTDTEGKVTGQATATDPNNDTLTYSGSTETWQGSVTVNADGSFTYTPSFYGRHVAAADEVPPELQTFAFSITATDSHGGTITIPVSLAIAPHNDAPTAASEPTIGTPAASDGKVTGSLNITDADGDYQIYTVTGYPAKGEVRIDYNGNFTYTPTPQARLDAFAGGVDVFDSFTVAVRDGYGGSTTVTVTGVPVSPVSAAAVGHLVLFGDFVSYSRNGGQGEYYLTVSGGTDGTRVIIVDPADPTNPTIVTTGGETAYGGVVFGSDGRAYQASYSYENTGSWTEHTYVSVIDPTDPTNPTVVDLGIGKPSSWLKEGPDGNMYLALGNTSDGHGRLAQITPTHPSNPTIIDIGPGVSDGYVAKGPDGKLYVTSATYSTAYLVRIDPTDLTNPTIIEAGAGRPASQPFFGSDGTIYLVSQTGSWGSSYTNHIAVITPSNPDHASVIELPPSPTGYLSYYGLQTNYGPGGIAYVKSSQEYGAETVYYVSVLDPAGTAAPVTITIPSYPENPIFGPDGAAYITSTKYVGATGTAYLTVIDPQNPAASTSVMLAGRSADYRPPMFSPDGTLSILTYDYNSASSTYSYYLNTLDPTHPATVVSTSLGSYASSSGMSLAGATDEATYLTTTLMNGSMAKLVVLRNDPQNPVTVQLPGNSNWDDAVGAQGTLYSVTRTYTPGSGYSGWSLTIIDPHNANNPTTVSLTGQPSGGFVVTSDGDVLLPNGYSYNAGTGYSARTLLFSAGDPLNRVTISTPGYPASGGLFATTDGRAVQVGYDIGSGHTVTLAVIDPDHPTAPSIDILAGDYRSGPVEGPDGRYYLTIDGGAAGSRVVVIDPADATNPTIVDTGGQTAFTGVYFGTDGKVYQTSYTTSAGVSHTFVSVIDPADPLNPTLIDLGDGRPISYDLYNAGDGNLYLVLGGTTNSHIRLARINPADPTTPIVVDVGSGTPLSPNVSADGTVYLTTYTGSNNSNYQTYVVRIDPDDPSHATIVSAGAGSPADSAWVHTDGYVYQTSQIYSGGAYTYITAVFTPDDPDHAVLITSSSSNAYAPQYYRTKATADGTLLVSSYYNGHYRIVVVDPQHPEQMSTITLPGTSIDDDDLFLAPNGKMYAHSHTYNSGTYTNYLTVIDPDNPAAAVDVTMPSSYGNTYTPSFTYSPEGAVYLSYSVYQSDNSTKHYLTIVDADDPASAVTTELSNLGWYSVVTATDDVALLQTYDGIVAIHRDDPSNPVVVASLPAGAYNAGSNSADGVVYLTGYEYTYNWNARYTTYVVVVDATDLDHPTTVTIAGAPGGSVIIGPDGIAVQPVYDQDAHTVTLVTIKTASAPTTV